MAPQEARSTIPAPVLPTTRRGTWLPRLVDLVLPVVLLLLGALAFAVLERGSPLRVALVVPTILFVPGYLLLQALLGPARTGRARGLRAVAALGVSPALVGLAALSTAWMPSGFSATAIVVAVTTLGAAFAAVGAWRLRDAAATRHPVAAVA